jgi:hypothetical protein
MYVCIKRFSPTCYIAVAFLPTHVTRRYDLRVSRRVSAKMAAFWVVVVVVVVVAAAVTSKMGGACRTHINDETCVQNFSRKT